MSNNYLSILVITHPMIAANARGQGAGNQQTLQHMFAGNSTHTVINGVAVAYSMRENVRKLGGKCWRLAGTTDSPSGFGYGPNMDPTMTKGGEGLKQFDYDDTALRGYMFAAAGSGEPGKKPSKKGSAKKDESFEDEISDDETDDESNKKAVKTVTARGCLQMSPAVSATPYDDSDVAFVKGLKEDGKLNPFTFQRHHTRYVQVMTFDLVSLAKRPGAVALALDALTAGMQVGGSHTSNLSEFAPEVLVWRFHTTQGAGLFLSPQDTSDWTPDRPVNLEPLYRKAENLGFRDQIRIGGLSVHPGVSISAAVKMIKDQVQEVFDNMAMVDAIGG